MYAYAHTPLDEDTIKLTSFSSGDKLFAFIRSFYGLNGLPIFLQNKCLPSLKLLYNNVLPSSTLTISHFYLTLKNTCSNSLNNYTLSVQKQS